jgi:hypothetical protein
MSALTMLLYDDADIISRECVRRRAVLSVRTHPGCPDEAIVQRAMDEARFRGNTRPFDQVNFLGHHSTISDSHASIDIREDCCATLSYS